MPRTVQVLAFIIGASWFFPVSCTTGLIVATPLLSQFDARRIEKGDQPHALFSGGTPVFSRVMDPAYIIRSIQFKNVNAAKSAKQSRRRRSGVPRE